jgi:hypothetical protein
MALVAYAAAPTLALAALAIFAVGGLYLGCLSSFTTIAQLRAPAAQRGRVLSVFFVLLGLLYPIGSVVQGAVADAVGLRATTAGAAVVLAAALLVLRTARRGFDQRLDDPVAEASSVDPAAGLPTSRSSEDARRFRTGVQPTASSNRQATTSRVAVGFHSLSIQVRCALTTPKDWGSMLRPARRPAALGT